MQFVKRIFALAMLCAPVMCWSFTAPPVDGIYWSSSQSGRGYAVETQDDLVFVAIYNYDSDGSPAFYTIQGTWDGTGRRIANAHLYRVSSGPWIGGPFSPIGPVEDKGPVTFEFPTFTTARFVYNGQSVNLTRFLYRYSESANSLMQGTWYSAFGSLGIYFGELVQIEGTCTVSGCEQIPESFYGSRIDGGSQRVLVGGRQSDGRVFFLLDSSTSYYELFVFDLRVNEWVGFSAAFLKTDAFPTSGLPMFAHRLTGPSFAPTAASVQGGADTAAVDAMKARSLVDSGAGTIEGKAVPLDDIRPMLPALKRAIAALQ